MTATEDRDPGDEHFAPAPRLTPESAAALRLGDAVHHYPSGEDWVLRYVNGDRLSWIGWPPGEANVADCSLVSRCSDEEHRRWTARPTKLNHRDDRGATTSPGDEHQPAEPKS